MSAATPTLAMVTRAGTLFLAMLQRRSYIAISGVVGSGSYISQSGDGRLPGTLAISGAVIIQQLAPPKLAMHPGTLDNSARLSDTGHIDFFSGGSIMSYPGGKNGSGVYQAIINQMPPHAVYIEPFLGAGAILRLKRPAACSIGIDIDADVLSKWTGQEIPTLQLIHADALHWLASIAFTSDTLVYLDPPYLMSTRRSQRQIYLCEFDQVEQHEQLLQILLKLPCLVAISGYYSPLYANLLHGWRAIQYTAQTRSGRTAEEWLWMNYPQPQELHDYRFLGKDFRERERITRKRKRWIERLKRMPDSERYSLLSALQDFRSTTP